MRESQRKTEDCKMRTQLKRILEKPRTAIDDEEEGLHDAPIAEKIWLCVLCCFQYFNVATTPAIMIFPELNEELMNLLWINEIFWFLDIVRKLLFQYKPGEDTYNIAVKYIKTRLWLDLIALLPQILYFMDPDLAFTKNVRLYQIWLLYYPAQLLIKKMPQIRGAHQERVITFAFATLAQITVLLHYMGCLFIYLGSERFIDFEKDHVPWTIANEDFHEMG